MDLDVTKRAKNHPHETRDQQANITSDRVQPMRSTPHRRRSLSALRLSAEAAARCHRLRAMASSRRSTRRQAHRSTIRIERMRNGTRCWHTSRRERGYKPGWAAHKYKEKFGTGRSASRPIEPVEPSIEVLSWVRSRNIACKASQKANAA